jgi:hypothetical protein
MEKRGGEGGCAGEDDTGPAGGGRGRTGRAGRGHSRRGGVRAGVGRVSASAAVGHRQGGEKGRRRGGETEREGAPPPGKVRGEWEMLCTDGKTNKRRNPRCNNGGFSPGKKTLAGAEAIDETNAAVPSDSADEARIGSNCSPELSPELEPPRTSASNTGS